ncbi:hypothetical protein QQ045_033041 [Rhodiola kirilowii]
MDHHEDESHGVSETHDKKDSAEAIARHEEIKKSVEAKLALRRNNLYPDRPDAGFLRSLDSSIKRNTAVIKKLKQINEEQKDALLDELRSLNLSKKNFSEAVAAICKARLKSADIQAAIQICSLLHQRYKDFSPTLAEGLLKVFSHGKSVEDVESDKNMKAMKKRSTLKLLVELFFVGVIEDSSIFNNIIKDLTSAEHFRDRDTTQTNLSLLASFARQGRIFLGLPLSGHDIHEEFFKALSITAEQKKLIRKAFLAYFDAVVELLQSEHSSLRQMEHDNAKVLNAKGELSDDAASSYEKLRKSYDQLYRNISSLAKVLDMQPPAMPEDSHTTRVTMAEDGFSLVAVKDSDVPKPIWDDEDTKTCNESLPDLRASVPAVLLGEAESKVNEQPSKTQDSLNGIEKLSDDDLLPILSSLTSLADRARASVLSRRWRNVWRSTTCLVFDPINVLPINRLNESQAWYIAWVQKVIDDRVPGLDLVQKQIGDKYGGRHILCQIGHSRDHYFLARQLIKAAESSIKAEKERLQKLEELCEMNNKLEITTQKDFTSQKRNISRTVRQIVGTSDSVTKKSEDLIKLLNDDQCPQSISLAEFAKRIIYRGYDCAPLNMFGICRVVVIVTSEIPHVMDIILAEFHKDCVYTVPKHISYSKDMFDSIESYFKILGYEGNLDFVDDYLRRVECCVEMYAALIQTQVDGILNPYGLEAGWTWLAAVLNNLPANMYTAVALHSFLRIAGFALYKKYEGQFIELLEVISDNFLKSMRPVEEHGYNYYYRRLEAYIKDKLFLKEPEGWRLGEFKSKTARGI